jgi:nitroreductase
MDENSSELIQLIKSRRSVKPAKMNGKHIPDETVQKILEAGNWAPTHKITEPWRFVVFAPDKAKAFCLEHAELYKNNTTAEKFNRDKYEKLIGNGNYVSHIVVVYMKRSVDIVIPEVEEIAAVSASIQNILLAATAYGAASFWSTGGMTHRPEMKTLMGISPASEDKVMGIIYLGYTDHSFEGKRIIPMEEKINWK